MPQASSSMERASLAPALHSLMGRRSTNQYNAVSKRSLLRQTSHQNMKECCSAGQKVVTVQAGRWCLEETDKRIDVLSANG